MGPLLFVLLVGSVSLAARAYAAKAVKDVASVEPSKGWRRYALLAGFILGSGGIATALFFSGITKGLLLWNVGVAIGISAVAISHVLVLLALTSCNRRG